MLRTHQMLRFPGLKLTGDFSHWVVVCERALNSIAERRVMTMCAERLSHLHARIGQPQHAQLSLSEMKDDQHEIVVCG